MYLLHSRNLAASFLQGIFFFFVLSLALAMSLITKYITKARVTFDPFLLAAASSRSFLARMPPLAKVDLKVLPQGSTTTPLIEVTFKDKHVMKADPAQMPYNDVADLLNSHSRRLLIDDAVKEN